MKPDNTKYAEAYEPKAIEAYQRWVFKTKACDLGPCNAWLAACEYKQAEIEELRDSVAEWSNLAWDKGAELAALEAQSKERDEATRDFIEALEFYTYHKYDDKYAKDALSRHASLIQRLKEGKV